MHLSTLQRPSAPPSTHGRISGSVALLTGSSGGIGEACAAEFARRGAQVIMHGRCADTIRTAGELGAKVVSADFRDRGSAEQLAAEAEALFGRVDVLVHCAGIGWSGPTEAMEPDRIDELIDVDLRAPIRLTRAVLPGMIERGYGHVAFVASIAGLTGVAGESVYSAAKAGLIAFAESLRLELTGTGVHVSVISPAAVRTSFFERRGTPYRRRIPRMVAPERVATAIVRTVERRRAGGTVPRWLMMAPAVRAAAPPLYRALSRHLG